MDARTVCIVGAARTPLGAFQGSLAALSAVDLGAVAIRGSLQRANVAPAEVDEMFWGNVLSANLGQAPATQAALKAGLPSSVPCTAVNKVCASAMKAVMLAAASIKAGDNDVVVAGGMESMSNAVHYLPKLRGGQRLGHSEVVDGLIKDGLWDPHLDVHMGSCAEMCADKYQVSRQDQDHHAINTHFKAQAARMAGWVENDIVPVRLPNGRVVTEDEGPSKMNRDKLAMLRPYFKKEGGSVTAGNASPLSDGAAALVLASYAAVQRLGLPVLATVLGYADAAQAPEWFTTAPALAIPKALKAAGLHDVSQVDFWEINEAFSVVEVANCQILKIAPEKVNLHGGAVALGHPIGASGARILVTLLGVLAAHGHGGSVGCAAICNGGGGASAMVLQATRPASL